MAKRISKEKAWFPRFLKWMTGGADALDEDIAGELDYEAAMTRAEMQKQAQASELQRDAHRIAAMEREKTLYTQAHTWMQNKGKKFTAFAYSALSVVICLAIIGLLLFTASELPPFGEPANPVNNEVSRRYIEKGQEETGAVNIVAGMILDYRAFDTLGESHVLFVAACTVLILLRITGDKDDTAQMLRDAETDDRMYEPKDDMILQHVARVLVPIILLFGIYVIMNGHISPGGGFSGGAIMGAGLILYLNAFGFKKTQRFFTFKTFRIISVAALAFYALSKTYSFFTGANHLHSVITPGTPGMLFSAGLIPYLNIAVGLVVCCTMYAFYTLFRKGDL